MGVFSRNSSGTVGRAAKPGETPNRVAKPVEKQATGTRVVAKSSPRTQGS